MTLSFHLYQDGIEIAEPEIYARDLKAYAADSQRAEHDFTIRRRNSFFERIFRDLKENGCDYIVGLIVVVAIVVAIVGWQTALAESTPCQAWHLVGNERQCLN
jgi:hypothetical protein